MDKCEGELCIQLTGACTAVFTLCFAQEHSFEFLRKVTPQWPSFFFCGDLTTVNDAGDVATVRYDLECPCYDGNNSEG